MKHSRLAQRGYNYRRVAVVFAMLTPAWTMYCWYCTVSPIITILSALVMGIPSLFVIAELLDNGNYYLQLAEAEKER